MFDTRMICFRSLVYFIGIFIFSFTANDAYARRKANDKVASKKTATERLQPVLTIKNFGKINEDLKTLNEVFQYKKDGKIDKALEKLREWQTASNEETFYKDFFLAEFGKSSDQFWKLYQQLSKNKKLLRVQLESLKNILQYNLDSNQSIPVANQVIIQESKKILKKVKNLPEGFDFETVYLKWLEKNSISHELCKSERDRWLSQASLELEQIKQGLKSCPIKFEDVIFRTRMLVFSGYENKAKVELEIIQKEHDYKPWEDAYLKAVLFSNTGDPVAAFNEIKPYEKEVSADAKYADNLFYIAQRAGELSKAEDYINQSIKNAYKRNDKRDFEFQKAFLFYQTKHYKEAIVILTHLIKTHPALKRKYKNTDFDNLTWLRAWCYYLDKNYQMAAIEFEKNKAWAKDKARNLYWLAQSEWAQDYKMKAIDYYRQLALPVINGQFFNYYNFLAWLRYETDKGEVYTDLVKNQMNLMKGGRGTYIIPDDSINPIRFITEYKTYYEDIAATDEGDIQIINQDTVAADNSDLSAIEVEGAQDLKNQIKWADSLISWGYSDFAKWHLYEVERALRNRKMAEPLIQYYLDKKFYYRALSLMQKLASPSGRKLALRDDELLWRAFYPKAYQNNVISESVRRKISPYMIWSIMKAETQYKSDAISPVGAVGLMQFMPYTSLKVAELIKDKNHNPHDLFNPDMAIQYGAAYLKKLALEFDDQVPLMAAAYNGGPHRVKFWLDNQQRNTSEDRAMASDDNKNNAKSDTNLAAGKSKEKLVKNLSYDEFIEHIPFSETRTYVKRVISYFVTNQKLYEEKIDINRFRYLIQEVPYKSKEPISLKEEWDFKL